ncbi:hypothetical protein WQ57_24120 [Mesobacillus campisalis]|uniref:Uncharacterized protein n=2 Tax=Mesobacillus campisalis TaxID=1408103 RepID=A0A0M2SKD1_9BACI|nr:hypothetical protein WQ57_24120 [Mesobacillus campisalis]
MAKKNEAVEVEKQEVAAAEEAAASDLLVDTFWNQYETSLARARQLREVQEEAFMTAFKELVQFNKQYRKSVASLYEQSKKTNLELAKGVMQNISDRKAGKSAEEARAMDYEQVTKQLKEVTMQLEKLALTPVKSAFSIIDQLEDNVEKSAESYLAYARERRAAWQQVTNEYVKQARKVNHQVVDRVSEKSKELVKA